PVGGRRSRRLALAGRRDDPRDVAGVVVRVAACPQAARLCIARADARSVVANSAAYASRYAQVRKSASTVTTTAGPMPAGARKRGGETMVTKTRARDATPNRTTAAPTMAPPTSSA